MLPVGSVVDGSVEEQRDVGFAVDKLKQEGVEEDGVALGIAPHIFDEDLINDASFAGPAVVVAHVRGGAEDPEADFAGSVTAKHRAVLHEKHANALTCGGDGAANTGEAASYNDEVGCELL